MHKKILYIDMDGVLADFDSAVAKLSPEVREQYRGHLDDVPGLFLQMDPIPGAIDAALQLAERFDTYILSTAPWNNPSSWADKVTWIQRHLGKPYEKRLILSHHKDLLKGDFLIDDRPKHGADSFEGKWIQFGSKEYPHWKSILEYLLRER